MASNSRNIEEFVTMTTHRTEVRSHSAHPPGAPQMAKNSANLDVSAPTDEALLALHRQDSQGPHLAELVKRYERELFNYLRRFLGDAVLAEDAFQATFLQVHLKADQFDSDRKFRPWLYTVATNRAIDIQRRNKRHQLVSLDRPNRSEHTEVGSLMDLLPSREGNPGERMDGSERIEWVRRAVAALPEQLRTAVSLVYFRGLKYREAAAEMSVPVGTVKSRLHSALSRLGEAYDNGQ
jgi:RNA polymerase sigma-70 factor, ECF subfamily